MLLSTLIFLPLLFAVVIAVAPERITRPLTLLTTLAHLGLSLLLFNKFDPELSSLQLVEKVPWLPELGVNYFVGIDGISFWLVLLTTFMTPVVVAASWSTINKQVKAFHISMLVLESAMIGSFLAFDTILFYTFLSCH